MLSLIKLSPKWRRFFAVVLTITLIIAILSVLFFAQLRERNRILEENIALAANIVPDDSQQSPIELAANLSPNRISYNVNATSLNPFPLIDHLEVLHPSTLLIMDGLWLADSLEIERDWKTLIIHRDYSPHEGDEWQAFCPQEFVSRWLEQGSLAVWRYTTNEPFLNDGNVADFVAHSVELMRLARENDINLVVGNFSVGSIQPQWIADGIFDPFLMAIYQYHHILGVHEYSFGAASFGYGNLPNSCLSDRACMQPENWLAADELRLEYPTLPSLEATFSGQVPFDYGAYFLSMPWEFLLETADGKLNPPHFYIRRADWFLLRADLLGIPRPRIIVTEGFWDYLGVVQPVLSGLESEYGLPEYGNHLRGQASLCDLWAWYWSDWSCDEAAYQQLRYLDEIYPEEYIGFNLFTWTANPDWANFDLSQRTELQRLLEEGN